MSKAVSVAPQSQKSRVYIVYECMCRSVASLSSPSVGRYCSCSPGVKQTHHIPGTPVT